MHAMTALTVSRLGPSPAAQAPGAVVGELFPFPRLENPPMVPQHCFIFLGLRSNPLRASPGPVLQIGLLLVQGTGNWGRAGGKHRSPPHWWGRVMWGHLRPQPAQKSPPQPLCCCRAALRSPGLGAVLCAAMDLEHGSPDALTAVLTRPY